MYSKFTYLENMLHISNISIIIFTTGLKRLSFIVNNVKYYTSEVYKSPRIENKPVKINNVKGREQ